MLNVVQASSSSALGGHESLMAISRASRVAAVESDGDRRRWIALSVVCLAMFMSALDSSIVNVALPDIQQRLHLSQSGLRWVIDAYPISFGSFLLMAGRLGTSLDEKSLPC